MAVADNVPASIFSRFKDDPSEPPVAFNTRVGAVIEAQAGLVELVMLTFTVVTLTVHTEDD